MAIIVELLDGNVTLEIECLDRLYLNGYIGPMASLGGLLHFLMVHLGKPVPSPAVLGQISEGFRNSMTAMAEQQKIPVYRFNHKERKDEVANQVRKPRGVRDQVVSSA